MDFGTHSFRKGCATYCSGFIGGPSSTSIFLRAGWSMGQVQDRYLHYNQAGDQLCGRICSGLSFNEGSKFCVLPPLFSKFNILCVDEWVELLPMYKAYPASFKATVPHLLASIAFHYDWLLATDENGDNINISARHPIFQSRVMTQDVMNRVRSHVLPLNTDGKCYETGISATGVPPFIDISRQLAVAQKENEELREQIRSNHHEVMTTLPQIISSHIVENFQVQGVQQMSRSDMCNVLTGVLSEWSSQHFTSGIKDNVTRLETVMRGPLCDANGFRYWIWADGLIMRPCPENYHIHNSSVKHMMDLFYSGVPSAEIRPLRMFKEGVVKKQFQVRFSKARHVWRCLIHNAIELNIIKEESDINAMTMVQWDTLTKKCLSAIIQKIRMKKFEVDKKQTKIKESITYVTMYDYLNTYPIY